MAKRHGLFDRYTWRAKWNGYDVNLTTPARIATSIFAVFYTTLWIFIFVGGLVFLAMFIETAKGVR